MPRKIDLQIPKFYDDDVGIVISNTIFLIPKKEKNPL